MTSLLIYILTYNQQGLKGNTGDKGMKGDIGPLGLRGRTGKPVSDKTIFNIHCLGKNNFTRFLSIYKHYVWTKV